MVLIRVGPPLAVVGRGMTLDSIWGSPSNFRSSSCFPALPRARPRGFLLLPFRRGHFPRLTVFGGPWGPAVPFSVSSSFLLLDDKCASSPGFPRSCFASKEIYRLGAKCHISCFPRVCQMPLIPLSPCRFDRYPLISAASLRFPLPLGFPTQRTPSGSAAFVEAGPSAVSGQRFTLPAAVAVPPFVGSATPVRLLLFAHCLQHFPQRSDLPSPTNAPYWFGLTVICRSPLSVQYVYAFISSPHMSSSLSSRIFVARPVCRLVWKFRSYF